jgi:AhpD family alkylhydroperoxidase
MVAEDDQGGASRPMQRSAASPSLTHVIALLDQVIGRSVSLPHPLIEAAFLRASVVNGCLRCVRRHSAALGDGEVGEYALQALLDPEGPAYAANPRLKAVVDLADLLSASPVRLEVEPLTRIRSEFSEQEIADLAVVIAGAAAINRLVIASSLFNRAGNKSA